MKLFQNLSKIKLAVNEKRMSYCEDNIDAVNTKLQLFVEKGSVNSVDLDAFEKI